jgi:LacI family transcriptional regulator
MAGVSTSTVSHVVNETRPVSDGTRLRVLRAIRATGYRQDSVARSLRRSRTDSVGLVVSDVAQPVFAEMVHGVEHAATAMGYTLLLSNSGEDPAREVRSLQALTARRVDGLIVAPVARSRRRELEAIRRTGLPIVLMDRLGSIRTDQVGVENAGPVRELVHHLVEHGHHRIAMAGGDLAVATIAERCQGYLEALEQAGIEPVPEFMLNGSGLSADTTPRVVELLELPDRPTAIIAASTEAAIGVLQAANVLRLNTPTDFAFATFDGFPHADLFRPGITTITAPAHAIGRTAMELLLRRLGGGGEVANKTVRLKPEITYRESCGCLPFASQVR